MRLIGGFLLAVALIAAVAAIVIYTGAYDVAASRPHNDVVRWALSTTMERSVAARADEIEAPSKFTEAQVKAGYGHFSETCVHCHGAPGVARGAIGAGLSPQAPSLEHAAQEWTPGELFWIVKHGVRMTGMPAFGETYDDPRLWETVAFLDRLPGLGADGYARMGREAAQSGQGEQGEQGEQGPGHEH